MDIARYTIIIAAAALLLASLLPVRRLLVGLPAGPLRRGWHLLAILVVLMIGAELIYALDLHARLSVPRELMMPVALLAGSWFVMLIAQLSAGSIEDVHRLIRLETESVTDGLTGLYNRHYLDDRLGEEMERARRQSRPLSLMLIDADHFKQVNDRHGHMVGDRALAHLASVIRAESRQCDVVVRFGGEEILVLAPGTNLSQIRWQAERLRRRVAAQPLQLGDGAQLKLTVSVGVGELDLQDRWQPHAFVRRVDSALYRAKARGRNRVEVAPLASTRERVAHFKDWIAQQRRERAA